MRCSAFAGDDAREWLRLSDGELLASHEGGGFAAASIRVLVRFVEAGVEGLPPHLSARIYPLCDSVGLQGAFDGLQRRLLCCHSQIDAVRACVPPDVVAEIRRDLRPIWSRSVRAASDEFFALCTSSCAQLLDTVEQHGVTLAQTGQFLHIAPRFGGGAPFFGYLLANAALKTTCAEWLAQQPRDGLHDAPVEMTLHTCAVQVCGTTSSSISTYIGASADIVPVLHQAAAAIVPLASVLVNFHVIPCEKAEVLPSSMALRPSFCDLFAICDQCFKTYLRKNASFVGETRKRPRDTASISPISPSVSTASTASTASLASLASLDGPGGPAMPASDDECALRLFFGFDMNSSITIGGAYSELCRRQAPPHVQAFCLHAAVQFGSQASLEQTFASCTAMLEAAQDTHTCNQLRTDLARARRIADAALGVAQRRRPEGNGSSQTATPISLSDVKRLLAWFQLDISKRSTTIRLEDNDLASLAHQIASRCFGVSELTPQELQALERLGPSAKTFHSALRSISHALERPIALVSQTSRETSIAKISLRGVEPTSIGFVIDAVSERTHTLLFARASEAGVWRVFGTESK